jgi:hypothetical protein
MTTNQELRKWRAEARRTKTAYICAECREANRLQAIHPGVQHLPGICDCICVDPR